MTAGETRATAHSVSKFGAPGSRRATSPRHPTGRLFSRYWPKVRKSVKNSVTKKEGAMMEFHISRDTRSRYQVDEVLFSYTGNVVFADLAASRKLANRINEVRSAAKDPEVVNPAALFAMGLIDEISHALVSYYRKNYDPEVMKRALSWFEAKIGAEGVEKLLHSFVAEFPNAAVYRGRENAAQWLAGSTDGVPHREGALEEILLLWLANQNRAFNTFKELFDDQTIGKSTDHPTV